MNDVNFVGGSVLPESASAEHIITAAGEVMTDVQLLDELHVLAHPDMAAAMEEPAKPNGFELLGLAPELVQAVADMGYTDPTAVQNKAIPMALNTGTGSYADLMVSSQTGSGKTAAFLLPVLHTLLKMQEAEAQAEKDAFEQACADAIAKGEPAPKRAKRKDPTNPRNFKPAVPGALVVCPTRELAQQVANDGIDLVRHCRGLRIANVVGGMPYQLQVAKLQNANLVVATPGRLLDLQRSQQLKAVGFGGFFHGGSHVGVSQHMQLVEQLHIGHHFAGGGDDVLGGGRFRQHGATDKINVVHVQISCAAKSAQHPKKADGGPKWGPSEIN